MVDGAQVGGGIRALCGQRALQGGAGGGRLIRPLYRFIQHAGKEEKVSELEEEGNAAGGLGGGVGQAGSGSAGARGGDDGAARLAEPGRQRRSSTRARRGGEEWAVGEKGWKIGPTCQGGGDRGILGNTKLQWFARRK
uniref:Uncharacterized protein n=1 Tax=Oryza punctata TaxID=4537 RepID=A0A0E0KZH4_ORYPU